MANTESAFTRHDVRFGSGDGCCSAWHYVPATTPLANDAGQPCIVMAHGFGGTRDAGLEPYAETFAAAGMHVLLFDYRHFGASDGEPRQLISVARQLADWHAAIAYARSLEAIDGTRIGLWGSSFSGGHVVVVAAQDEQVAAVSAQAANLDGMATLRSLMANSGVGHVARVTLAGMRDQAAALMGSDPVMLPVVAEPGAIAAMSTPDARAGYLSIAPKDWDNRFCARVMLGFATYRPIRQVARVRCPILFIACTQDSITPLAPIRRASQLARSARLVELDMGHFGIYVDDGFRRSSSEQLAFFQTELAAA